MFQKDNACPHNAYASQHAIQHILKFSWPSQSLDLSSTEHIVLNWIIPNSFTVNRFLVFNHFSMTWALFGSMLVSLSSIRSHIKRAILKEDQMNQMLDEC